MSLGSIVASSRFAMAVTRHADAMNQGCALYGLRSTEQRAEQSQSEFGNVQLVRKGGA